MQSDMAIWWFVKITEAADISSWTLKYKISKKIIPHAMTRCKFKSL